MDLTQLGFYVAKWKSNFCPSHGLMSPSIVPAAVVEIHRESGKLHFVFMTISDPTLAVPCNLSDQQFTVVGLLYILTLNDLEMVYAR